VRSAARDSAGRRAVLQALVGAPLVALAARAEARDYSSAAEVLAEIDRLESEVDVRLSALAASTPSAAGLSRSVRADHERHRATRAAVRARLHLASAAASPAPPPPSPALTLAQLQAIAQDLVHAYAEGLPAIGSARAVDALARDMVDDARHLAVLQMWAETEESGA
jgi:hypothetical protein